MVYGTQTTFGQCSAVAKIPNESFHRRGIFDDAENSTLSPSTALTCDKCNVFTASGSIGGRTPFTLVVHTVELSSSLSVSSTVYNPSAGKITVGVDSSSPLCDDGPARPTTGVESKFHSNASRGSLPLPAVATVPTIVNASSTLVVSASGRVQLG